MEIFENLNIGGTMTIGQLTYKVCEAKSGCFGCAFHGMLKDCVLKGMCTPRFRSDKKRVIFTAYEPERPKAPEPFLIVVCPPSIIEIIKGERLCNYYEKITLNNIDARRHVTERIELSEKEANEIIRTTSHSVYTCKSGRVYDFNNFEEAFKNRRKILREVMNMFKRGKHE